MVYLTEGQHSFVEVCAILSEVPVIDISVQLMTQYIHGE